MRGYAGFTVARASNQDDYHTQNGEPALFAGHREISVSMGLRGGAGRLELLTN
jgi:hypothetical protein